MDPIDSNPWNEDEFNARPIRLASKKTRSNSNQNEEFKMKPIRLSKRNDEDKKLRISGDTDRSSERNSKEYRSSKEFKGSRNSDDSVPPMTSPTSNPQTPRRKSIQIKNLPIIETSPPKLKLNYAPVSKVNDKIFAICMVDFHHIRGPEIQWWKSNYVPEISPDLFKNLPFQSLPDGSHLFEETFSNFNLVFDFSTNRSYDNLNDLINFNDDPRNLQTLFGCACIRQININELPEEELKRNRDIKRSIIQKSLVIINRDKPIFTKIKDKLSIITKSYFLQDNLSNFDIFNNLFDNLNSESYDDNEEFFINLNLKQSIIKLKYDFLSIFKAMLLEKKILIYSNNNLELLTKFQNNLISLIPNLINNLTYSGCQLSDYQEIFTGSNKLVKPHHLNTENRDSMLNFFGLPLKLFNTKGSFWNPYLPLQQINQLNFPETKSFIIGCSNLLFVNQLKSLGVEVMINLDTFDVTYPQTNNCPPELNLTAYDKNFISNLLNNALNDDVVVDNENYVGNDDYIRFQFEDYLLSLLSSVRFNQYVTKFSQYPPGFTDSPDPEISINEDSSTANGDLNHFNNKFVDSWKQTQNFTIWDMTCDEFIFNFINPRHVQVDSYNQSTLSSFFNNLNLKLKANNVEERTESRANKFIPRTFDKEDFDDGPQKPKPEKRAWSWGFKR